MQQVADDPRRLTAEERDLVARNVGLALKVAHLLTRQDCRDGAPLTPAAEAARDGALDGLFQAARDYSRDPRPNKVKFSTFAGYCCRNQALNALGALRCPTRGGGNPAASATDLDDPAGRPGGARMEHLADDRGPGPAELAERRELAARALEVLARLPRARREAVARRLGIGRAPQLVGEVARELGVTHGAVTFAYQAGIAALRKALKPGRRPAADWRPACRAAWAAGEGTARELAGRFGVSPSAVYRAVFQVDPPGRGRLVRRPRPAAPDGTDDLDRRLLEVARREAAAGGDRLPAAMLARALGQRQRTVQRRVRRLEAAGLWPLPARTRWEARACSA